MGFHQTGLLHLGAVCPGWHILVIDIKDCIFINTAGVRRWRALDLYSLGAKYKQTCTTLPMESLPTRQKKNSPIICQIYVQQALKYIPNNRLVICYMHDILLAHPHSKRFKKFYPKYYIISHSLRKKYSECSLLLSWGTKSVRKYVFSVSPLNRTQGILMLNSRNYVPLLIGSNNFFPFLIKKWEFIFFI